MRIGFDNSTLDYFRGLGYNITLQSPTAGSTSHCIVRFPDGLLEAVSDPRKVSLNLIVGWEGVLKAYSVCRTRSCLLKKAQVRELVVSQRGDKSMYREE